MGKRKKDEEQSTGAKRKAPQSGGKANEGITSMLMQLSDYEKNVAAQPFKAKVYKKAAHTVAGLDYQIRCGKEATKLPGIGKMIGEKIDEYITTGKLRKLEKINNDETSTAMLLLTRVNGIGPVAARSLVEKGVKSLEDLEKIRDTLPHAQQIGLKYFHEFEERIPRYEIDNYKELSKTSLARYDSAMTFEICGSYRRGKESSFDIDILICHPDFTSILKEPPNKMLRKVVDHLQSEGLLTETLSLGKVKFMGVGCVPSGKPRRIDIRIVPKDQYWSGVLYFTGSDVFNQEMRSHALALGFTLNEYSIRPVGALGSPGEPLQVTGEEDVFDYLGLTFQKPSTRTTLLVT